MTARKRVRDAGTGLIVPASEAKARPNETIVEDTGKDGLAKRVALLENVIEEAGGPLAVLYRRRKRGLTD